MLNFFFIVVNKLKDLLKNRGKKVIKMEKLITYVKIDVLKN